MAIKGAQCPIGNLADGQRLNHAQHVLVHILRKCFSTRKRRESETFHLGRESLSETVSDRVIWTMFVFFCNDSGKWNDRNIIWLCSFEMDPHDMRRVNLCAFTFGDGDNPECRCEEGDGSYSTRS